MKAAAVLARESVLARKGKAAVELRLRAVGSPANILSLRVARA